MRRILYYFANYNTMMFQWQKKHIFDEMYTHGWEFDVISPHDFPSIDQANEAILDRIKKNKYELFMSSYSTSHLYIDTLAALKNAGIATLCFCPDNLVVPYNQKEIARYYDLVWLTSSETQYLFKKWKARTIVLPYAANPNLLKPTLLETKSDIPRIAFVGTPHGSRVERLNNIIEGGIPITIYANRSDTSNVKFRASFSVYVHSFSNYMKFPIGRKLFLATVIDKFGKHSLNLDADNLELEKPVDLNQLGNIYREYALVLAFTEANSTGVLKNPVPIVNLRNFEIPMSGGLEITLYNKELATYFEPDKEIILCESVDDLIEKVQFYLKDEQYETRMKMKNAARARATSEHTWYNRFQHIFGELQIKE